MDLQPITLDAKPLIDEYIGRSPLVNSEFTFTNLFVWRHSYNIHYAQIHGCLAFASQHGDSPLAFTFPIGDNPAPAIREMLSCFADKNLPPLIRLYSTEQASLLHSEFPGKFALQSDRDNFDYVYETDKLITLSGKKLHAKRNHVNRFKEEYFGRWRYASLTPSLKAQCLDLYNKWYAGKTGHDMAVNEAKEAFVELLNNWEHLPIVGGALYVDEEMAAFTFGEPRSQDTAVIHFEHADTTVHGGFQTINQQFLEHEFSNFKYVNRAEDMGLMGLRKAKQSYRPAFMIEKHIATEASQ